MATPSSALPPLPAGAGAPAAIPGARAALMLLIAISLFNYIDRQVLSGVLPRLEVDPAFGLLGDPNAKFWKNLLATAFLVTYMVCAPLFGWLGDRLGRRWGLVGMAVIAWSLVSGASGLAVGYTMLLLTRCLIGVGEGAYGPVGMALLSDAFPPSRRGMAIALMSAAIPVGSALGFALGTVVADSALGWRWAFYLVVPPGVLLGLLCFRMPEPRRGQAEGATQATAPVGAWRAVKVCLQTPSYFLSTAGYTAMTFVTGGIAVVVIDYVHERQGIYALSDETLKGLTPETAERLRPLLGQRFEGADDFKYALRGALPPGALAPLWGPLREASRTADSPNLGPVGVYFGGITVVAGLLGTLLGAYVAERLKPRVPSADFLVSAAGAFAGMPLVLAFLYVPFPAAWGVLFFAIFCLFLNTGPVNTILANVTAPPIRATAFALNIFLLHALGDVISPPIIGTVTDRYDWTTAFLMITGVIVLAGVLWAWGAMYLKRDTEMALRRLAA
jgi:MFS transporter, Spinster family, sphingosine-1-phosphate transporter